MSIDTAVEELQVARRRLQGQLADLEAQRNGLASELDRVEAALSALHPAQGNDIVDGGAPMILELTGKYRPLWQTLCDREDDSWAATFADVEGVLGFSLPPSSRRHLAHWYGVGGSSVAAAVNAAGWRSSRVNLENETVTFLRRS